MTRGPYTFRGYYKSPQHNAEAFDADGFYCSGDLISIDEDGYITVQGREKDQINRGGEKIAAEEIENLLLRHPAAIHARWSAWKIACWGKELRVSGGERASARGGGTPLPA
jgi:2,3-dihydroxybenzoate-AMP ligase